MSAKIIGTIWRYFPIILLASLISLAASSYYLYNSFKPDYIESESSIHHYSAIAHFSGGARVEKDNPIWKVGDVVQLPVYSYDITPEYRGNFHFTTTPPGDVNIETETKIVYYYQVKDAPVWEKTVLTLTNRSQKETEVSFTINMTELKSKINQAQNAFGVYVGKSGAEIIETVKYSGKIKGKDVDETLTFRIPVKVESTYYSFSELNESRDYFVKTTEIIPVQKPITSKIVPSTVLLASLSVMILSITVKTRYRNVEDLEKEMEKREKGNIFKKYQKWISLATLPDLQYDKVELESLEDIVNAANDMMERVFYDRRKGLYFFVHDGVLYYSREKTF